MQKCGICGKNIKKNELCRSLNPKSLKWAWVHEECYAEYASNMTQDEIGKYFDELGDIPKNRKIDWIFNNFFWFIKKGD